MFNWYEIRVKGHLEPGWLDWFDGLQIQNLENGETSLIGPIPIDWLYEVCWINYGILA